VSSLVTAYLEVIWMGGDVEASVVVLETGTRLGLGLETIF